MIHRRRVLLLGAALSVSMLTAACGSGDDGGAPESLDRTAAVSDADVRAALQAGGNLTVWSWEPTLEKVVAGFQTKYPKVKVKLVNAGTNKDEYAALQDAIKAGFGVPDVVHVEYYALPQFALDKAVTDLTPYGAGTLQSTFTPGPWQGVHSGKGIYGLPMDSGPMALFYNKEVFDRYGLTVPKTWEEYAVQAGKLHRANGKAYITADTGDAGFTTSMIWQAGGRPYQVRGEAVGVNFADAGAKRFTATWQKLIDDKLLSPVSNWTDAWFQGLGDGTIATLATGAWMPANLESGVKAGHGKWRVAPMPQWASGETANSENGGSSLAIPAVSTVNKTLAYAFLKYATVEEGAQSRADNGAFPATIAQLSSPGFLEKKDPYFGGQQVNKVLADAAKQVGPNWSYLPYQVYANNVYGDTVGKAYLGGRTLADGLKAWQDASLTYGRKQGFIVE